MKLILPLLFVVLLVSCVSTPLTPKTLNKFENWEAVNRFAKQRIAAIEKIDEYPTKSEFFEKLKFWKKGQSQKEELIVTGIRASVSDSNLAVEEVSDSREGITNNQEQLVDEGGIVKRLGDYMVVLRRGKLYSLHVGKTLSKVDEISVQQDNWTHEAWYDEMLAGEGRVVVVGYSDQAGAEYLFFEVSANGKFTRGSVNLVKSSDYYSGENYASRLVGDNLIFLMKDIPITDFLGNDSDGMDINLYASRVDLQGKVTESCSLFSSNNIYEPILYSEELTATTVAVCPLNAETFHCSATTILGGLASEAYASQNAYYVWMTGSDWHIPFETMPDKELKKYAWNGYLESVEDKLASAVYRIPYDGVDVGVVKTKGQPIDQFSFNEKNGKLMVLSRVPMDKDYYYEDPSFAGSTYFLSIEPRFFEAGVFEYPESDYTKLADDESGWKLNRFIGDRLLYIDNVWRDDEESEFTKVKIFDADKLSLLQDFDVSYSVNVIQKVGGDALLMGYEGSDDLRYSMLSLNDERRIVDSKVLKNFDISDFRSHAFFYNPDIGSGVFAFPVDANFTDGPTSKYENGVSYDIEPITTMLYTQVNADLTMTEAGQLEGSRGEVWVDSKYCAVSCTDWYGSSRPIFWDGRIFSLIKYELIEGIYANGKVSEVTRLNFK